MRIHAGGGGGPYYGTTGWNTDFDSFSHEQLVAMLEAGDAGTMTSTAANWRTASSEMYGGAGELGNQLEALRGEWEGEAADAYFAKMDALLRTMEDTARVADQMNRALNTASYYWSSAKGQMDQNPPLTEEEADKLAGEQSSWFGSRLWKDWTNQIQEQRRQKAVKIMKELGSGYEEAKFEVGYPPEYEGPPPKGGRDLTYEDDGGSTSRGDGSGSRTTDPTNLVPKGPRRVPDDPIYDDCWDPTPRDDSRPVPRRVPVPDDHVYDDCWDPTPGDDSARRDPPGDGGSADDGDTDLAGGGGLTGVGGSGGPRVLPGVGGGSVGGSVGGAGAVGAGGVLGGAVGGVAGRAGGRAGGAGGGAGHGASPHGVGSAGARGGAAMRAGMGPMMGGGGGQGDGEAKKRKTWLIEDEDVWGAGDQPTAPPVLGGGDGTDADAGSAPPGEV